MITRIDERIALNDGKTMPGFGLGCYKTESGEETYNSVRSALDAGYRMIDTATFYENERDVGRAVRESGVPREEIFVVSKIWPLDFSQPEKAAEYSMRELDIGYLDLYLLHWPHKDADLRYRAWETLLEKRAQGKFLSIGVSNFMADQLADLAAKFSEKPAVNQIELHPWRQRPAVCDYCKENEIAIMGWSPLARSGIEDPLILELSQKYSRTQAQILLRWHVQREFILIPKSARAERIRENSQLFDFSLTQEDVQRINALECDRGVGRNDPYTFDGVMQA